MSANQDAASIQYHLKELRSRLKIILISLIVTSLVGFKFSSNILNALQSDLALSLNTFTPFEALYTQIMIALFVGFAISLPVILYEALQFAKPGLKRKEYMALKSYLPFSIVLFFVGAFFTYEFVVFNALEFFKAFNSSAELTAVWGLSSTMMFVLRLSVVSGLLFQLPVVAALLGKLGLIDSNMMKKYRSHVIVAVLVLSAVATPPDIITQVMIVLPIILLYEISVVLVDYLD